MNTILRAIARHWEARAQLWARLNALREECSQPLLEPLPRRPRALHPAPRLGAGARGRMGPR